MFFHAIDRASAQTLGLWKPWAKQCVVFVCFPELQIDPLEVDPKHWKFEMSLSCSDSILCPLLPVCSNDLLGNLFSPKCELLSTQCCDLKPCPIASMLTDKVKGSEYPHDDLYTCTLMCCRNVSAHSCSSEQKKMTNC